MITCLEIENFKPFGSKQSAPFAPLTLVYGPNSGGKSSIIQSLLLLRQSLGEELLPEHPVIPRGDYVDLGSFKSLLHKHDLRRTLRIGLSFDTRGLLPSRRGGIGFRRAAYASNTRRMVAASFSSHSGDLHADRTQLDTVEFALAGESSGDNRVDKDRLQVTLKRGSIPALALEAFPLEKNLNTYGWNDSESLKSYATFLLQGTAVRPDLENLWLGRGVLSVLEQIAGSKIRGNRAKYPNLSTLQQGLSHFTLLGRGTLPTILCPQTASSSGDGKQEPRLLLTPAPGLDALEYDFKSVIRSIAYLGPLRTPPERHYLLGGAHFDSVGRRGENTPQMLYYRSTEIISVLNRWFEQFSLPYTVDLRKIGDEVVGEMIVIRLMDRRTNTEVTPSDVGFGVGQLLPVIVQGLISKGQILCVEQPEIHLHPRLQATLGDFFLAASGAGEQGLALQESAQAHNQWLIETHSESLILRVLKRIREGMADPEKVSVLYVNPVDEYGSEILRLRIDRSGRFIDEWPEGFFEEAFQEMFF